MSGLSYLDTKLIKGVTYYYKVQAVAQAGSVSLFSNVASARTK